MTIRLSITLLALLLTACGGGSSGSAADTNPPVDTNIPNCNTSLTTGSAYECRVAALSADTRFSLAGAPEGMVIQPRSGYLHWTPSSFQSGVFNVDIIRSTSGAPRRDSLAFQVAAGTTMAPAGIYVSPSGNDSSTGSINDPLFSVHEAASRATPGDAIYLRGGSYFNDGFGTDFTTRSRNNLARITNSGLAGSPITLRAHGNEYAKLVSDVNGLVFNNAEYWRVQGLELEGTNPSLNREISLSLWWDDTAANNRIQGRGIAMNGSFNIDIVDCVIHDFSGAGLSNNNGAYITLADSIVYNNAWWSTAGTHGFANSKPATRDNADTTSIKITMQRNLLFGNQSSMISHVFSKGEVKMEIDEGNGLHMQNNAGTFFGRYLAEHNLSIYNGKAGLGLNTVDGSIIRNNSFFANAQAVSSSAELQLQSSTSDSIVDNLFHAQPERRTIRTSGDNYAGVGSNYAVPAADSDDLPDSVIQVSAVFANPEGNNFSRSSQVPTGNGVSPAVLTNLNAKQLEYGLQPAPAPTQVTESYLRALRAAIIPAWPDPDPNDSIPEDLILEDPDTGNCYAYADRNDYPGPPSSGTVCP